MNQSDCLGHYDAQSNYKSPQACSLFGLFCCGNCYNRTCCLDQTILLKQTFCVNVEHEPRDLV